MKKMFRPLIVVLAIVLIFSSVGIPVGAQEDIGNGILPPGGEQLEGNSVNVVPGGPGFIMIHPTAFIPLTTAGEWAFGLGGYLYNPGASSTFYVTEVNLPHGATINKIVLYYLDNSVENINLLLVKFGPEDSSTAAIGYIVTAGTNLNPMVLEDTSIDMNVIDNQSYGYTLQVGLAGGQGSTMQLRGVRIDYSYPVNLPLVTN